LRDQLQTESFYPMALVRGQLGLAHPIKPLPNPCESNNAFQCLFIWFNVFAKYVTLLTLE